VYNTLIYGSTYSNIIVVLDPMLTVSLYEKLERVCVCVGMVCVCGVCVCVCVRAWCGCGCVCGCVCVW